MSEAIQRIYSIDADSEGAVLIASEIILESKDYVTAKEPVYGKQFTVHQPKVYRTPDAAIDAFVAEETEALEKLQEELRARRKILREVANHRGNINIVVLEEFDWFQPVGRGFDD